MSVPVAILTPEQARGALVKIAAREIGVREAGGNNRGKRIREYQSATDLTPGAWPWCAAFVCFVLREWLKAPSVRAFYGFDSARAEKWRPKTAAAFGFLVWARERRLQILGHAAPCRAGDIVVYSFNGSGHIGLVAEDAAKESRFFTAIEGNTNDAGARDSESGDGVFLKRRERSSVRGFIRIL